MKLVIYGLIPPIQFEKEVLQQRHSRWKITQIINEWKEKVNNLLGEGSKDGNSQNIQRFSTLELGPIQTGDGAKAEAAKAVIDSAVSHISTSVDVIMKQRSTLFNRENNVKPWKANELKLYDDKI